MVSAEDRILGIIPVAIAAGIAKHFIPGEKKEKRSTERKGIFDFR